MADMSPSLRRKMEAAMQQDCDEEFITGDFTKFRRDFPNFQEPKEVGSFSVDGGRNFCNDRRNLRFFCEDVCRKGRCAVYNLSAGYNEAARKKMDKSERLDMILNFVLSNRKKLTELLSNWEGRSKVPPERRCLPVDFVCFRGLMTTLACTPYENREGWIICATKFRGNIYLCAFDTEADILRRANMSSREDQMSYWGYKFEQYVTSNVPAGAPDISAQVNENEEYCCMCRTALNKHSILFGAEIDCVLRGKENASSMSKYVELKTSREITSERQDRNFRRFKLIKWWTQSFLVGIKEIVCGFRDDDGFVKRLHTFPVGEIAKMSQSEWNPCICFNFLDQFLNYVKLIVKKDHPNVVYKFEWTPGKNIKCEELKTSFQYQILPSWYIEQISE